MTVRHKIIELSTLKQRGFCVRLPKGEAAIRFKQACQELVENPRAENVLIDFMSFAGANRHIKNNRTLIPYWNSLKLGGQEEEKVYLYLVGVYAVGVPERVTKKFGAFVPEWKVLECCEYIGTSSLTQFQKQALTEKYSNCIGKPITSIATKFNVSKGRSVEVINTSLNKLGLEGRWQYDKNK